ncbi:MAG: ABC transporter substrate-binding protein [Pseudomonadota bacterium]
MRSLLVGAVFATALWSVPSWAQDIVPVETDTLARTHDGDMPPVAERLPSEPFFVDIVSAGRELGRHGGDLDTLIGRAKDRRLVNVWGYARLVGYQPDLTLAPDLLRDIEVEEGRIFTLHLREGHRWSDGHPFTAEDFRFYWEDIAMNKDLAPNGPEPFMYVDGKLPTFEVIDDTTVRYAWEQPNPEFLPSLAMSRDPFIYRPAHYLKKLHATYTDVEMLQERVEEEKARSWAALHNQLDDMYGATNIEMPSLQPWYLASEADNNRFVFVRNPYFHRMDTNGRQLPYIDRLILTVADGKLIPTKTQAGETDLQARGLAFADVTVLKRAEAERDMQLYLWPSSKAAHLALYPNLTAADPVWREVFRDLRVRQALSLGIDRVLINRTLYFGLAEPSQNTATPVSPLYDGGRALAFTDFDPDRANKLLDDAGLSERRSDGIRLLPDGRPFEIIVESAGESVEDLDALELIKETWREIGVSLFAKASSRDILRARAASGDLQMAIWPGFDNGVPTPEMAPTDLAPTNIIQFQWSSFGAYVESRGQSGSEIDIPEVARLLELYKAWQVSASVPEQAAIWQEMLTIHSEQLFTIGIIGGVRQPVTAVPELRNLPQDAFYGWDPGAQFGLWRMDEFWLDG